MRKDLIKLINQIQEKVIRRKQKTGRGISVDYCGAANCLSVYEINGDSITYYLDLLSLSNIKNAEIKKKLLETRNRLNRILEVR